MVVKVSTEKKAQVAEISKKIQGSDLVIISNYSKLTVTADRELRRAIRKASAEYRVYKNSLTALALKELNITIDEKLLVGPTSFIFSKDPVAPSKVLVNFAKDNQALVIKGGIYLKQAVSAAQIKELAAMPSKQELLSKLVYLLQYPISGFVRVLNGPIVKLVYGLDAVAKKK